MGGRWEGGGREVGGRWEGGGREVGGRYEGGGWAGGGRIPWKVVSFFPSKLAPTDWHNLSAISVATFFSIKWTLNLLRIGSNSSFPKTYVRY